jgi:hydroxyacylglutathione hydrolase
MAIIIKSLTLGVATTNGYIVADSDTQRAIVIDPVADAPRFLKLAHDNAWKISLILATHAHFDHILASHALKAATGAPFYIHQDCQVWLDALPMQGQRFGLGSFPEAAKPDRLLTSESETLQLDSIHLETRYTPGHAPGHLAFYLASEKTVFSGDALFAGSIGRTDLPGGDMPTLMKSIFQQLLTLPDDTRVLSGHGYETSIGRERQTNPFITGWTDEF